MIVACYHPLPLSACMLHFDLVFILFGTLIPPSINILVKMFYTLYGLFMSIILFYGLKVHMTLNGAHLYDKEVIFGGKQHFH